MARKKLTIEEMQQIAISRGGKCLSEKYFGRYKKLKWQCRKGHIWDAMPDGIKNNGNWCPECAKTKLTIEEMHKVAKQNGGKCLSEVYVNNSTKLKWQCKEGHIWEATPMSIKNLKTWCPKCAKIKIKLTIKDMKMLAEKKGGKCLSDIYLNIVSELKWQCKEGHIWNAKSNNIKNLKTWCPICAKVKKLTIQEIKILAEKKGGKCLSEKYFNNNKNLKWKCKKGHIWEAPVLRIKNTGNWCPECSNSKSEKITRYWMEILFGFKFHKYKPKFLNLSKNIKLELDGYNKELKIAFEYDGRQHFMYVGFNGHKISIEEQEKILKKNKKI